MSYGPTQGFTCAIASGASSSSFIDFGGKGFSQFAVRYVTMSTGALVSVYGSDALAGTYAPITIQSKLTATVQFNPLTIPTTTSGSWAVFEAVPFRYLQFVCSAVVSGGVSFLVQAMD